MEKESRKNTSIENDIECGNSRRISHFPGISKSKHESKVFGFDNELLSLERMLLKAGNDEQIRTIGVVGMAGVGKTTLCQEIFNKKEVKEHFVPRIWISMSGQKTIVKLVSGMLEHLGVEGETVEFIRSQYELIGLLYALHQQLVGKRYLIILDDFDQDAEGWRLNLHTCSSHGNIWGQCLSDGLPKGYGGTVIVTSRNEAVAKNMVGEKNLRELQPLSDPKNCWSIYQEAAGPHFNNPGSPERLQKLKEKLQKKCGGLPLAAKLMGQIKAKQLAETTNTANQ